MCVVDEAGVEETTEANDFDSNAFYSSVCLALLAIFRRSAEALKAFFMRFMIRTPNTIVHRFTLQRGFNLFPAKSFLNAAPAFDSARQHFFCILKCLPITLFLRQCGE